MTPSPVSTNLTTVELLELYPELRMPSTPWSCKVCWDKWLGEWMYSIPNTTLYQSIHDKLLRVRQVLVVHHVQCVRLDRMIDPTNFIEFKEES